MHWVSADELAYYLVPKCRTLNHSNALSVVQLCALMCLQIHSILASVVQCWYLTGTPAPLQRTYVQSPAFVGVPSGMNHPNLGVERLPVRTAFEQVWGLVLRHGLQSCTVSIAMAGD